MKPHDSHIIKIGQNTEAVLFKRGGISVGCKPYDNGYLRIRNYAFSKYRAFTIAVYGLSHRFMIIVNHHHSGRRYLILRANPGRSDSGN